MSNTSFLQFIWQTYADPVLPNYDGVLPSEATLEERALWTSFLFSYNKTSEGTRRAVRQRLLCTGGVHSPFTAEDTLRQVLSVGWPARGPGDRPLLEVGREVVAKSAASHGGRCGLTEYLVATRYELVSSVFALERFTVIGVPPDAREVGADCIAASACEGVDALAVDSQQMAMAHELQNLRALRASAVPVDMTTEAKAATPAVELANLSLRQRQQMRVLLTLCRVISTAGGSVPDGATAMRNLLSLSRATAAAEAGLSPCAPGLSFPAFHRTNIPFLGVDNQRREMAWKRLQESGDVTAADQQAHLPTVSGFTCVPGEDVEGEKARGNTNTTLISNISSEQGQTSDERQMSTEHPSTAGRGLSSSAISSSSSCWADVAPAAAFPGSGFPNARAHQQRQGNGMQGRYSGSGRATREGSTGSTGSTAEAAVAGPVGVRPLPSVGTRVPATKQHSEIALGEGDDAMDCGATLRKETDAAVSAQIYAECGQYCTPLAMAQRKSHVHWQLSALESLFVACPPYSHHCGDTTAADLSVSQGWQQWAAACSGGLSRPLIVNSMDEIVHYCESPRECFFSAVAMLDFFVARTGKAPRAACLAFKKCVRAGRPSPPHSHVSSMRHREGGNIGLDSAGDLEQASDKDISTFFTQVICVCCMLGCKIKGRYPPTLKRVLACLNSNSGDGADSFTEVEFTQMEIFLLQRVFHLTHLGEAPTVNEVVDLLLFLVRGDRERDRAELQFYAYLLEQRAAEAQWLEAEMPTRIRSAERGLRRSRQEYIDGIELAVAQSRQHQQQQQPRMKQHPARLNEEAVDDDAKGDIVFPSLTADDEASAVREEEMREWNRLAFLSRFFCDLCVRGRKNTAEEADAMVTALLAADPQPLSAQSESRTELERQVIVSLQCRAQEVNPCALGVAILAIAAEALHMPLPMPLFAILPKQYKEDLVLSGLAVQPQQQQQQPHTADATRARHAHSSGSNSDGADPESAGDKDRSFHEEPPSFSSQQQTADAKVLGQPSAGVKTGLPLRPHDDLYLVLARFCAIFERKHSREVLHASRAPLPPLPPRECGDVDDSSLRRRDSGSRELEIAMAEVRAVCLENRQAGGACDAILRRRYRDMLRKEMLPAREEERAGGSFRRSEEQQK